MREANKVGAAVRSELSALAAIHDGLEAAGGQAEVAATLFGFIEEGIEHHKQLQLAVHTYDPFWTSKGAGASVEWESRAATIRRDAQSTFGI